MFFLYEIHFYNFAVSPLTDCKSWLIGNRSICCKAPLIETDSSLFYSQTGQWEGQFHVWPAPVLGHPVRGRCAECYPTCRISRGFTQTTDETPAELRLPLQPSIAIKASSICGDRNVSSSVSPELKAEQRGQLPLQREVPATLWIWVAMGREGEIWNTYLYAYSLWHCFTIVTWSHATSVPMLGSLGVAVSDVIMSGLQGSMLLQWLILVCV